MKSTLRFATAAGTALALARPAVAQPYGGDWGMWHGGLGWGHMAVGGFVMVLFWAGVIGLVVLLARGLFGGAEREPGPRRGTALDVLEERYARGEISREEFEERRGVLLASRSRR